MEFTSAAFWGLDRPLIRRRHKLTHTHNLTRKNILHQVAKTSNSPLLIPNISNLHNLHWTSLKDSYILKWLDKKLHLGSAVLGRTGD